MNFVATFMALRSEALKARTELACRCYTEGLHALVTLREHMAKGHHRAAVRCVRPIIEASLRSLYAAYVSTEKEVARNSFPKSLKHLAEGIEKEQPQYAPMFTQQLLTRSDSNGYTVDRLVNGWAHTDLTVIRPYCKPGALEQCCALWTAENFLAFAQAMCFSLDSSLTPSSPYSVKYY